jgi:hypothetical protein
MSFVKQLKDGRRFQEKLQLAKQRDHIELFQRLSVRPADVSQALLDVTPTIVHFSGHGTVGGALCFEDDLGQALPVRPNALAALFEQFAPAIKCVVLNACYSEEQARVISNHVDYVIGMSEAVVTKQLMPLPLASIKHWVPVAISMKLINQDVYKLAFKAFQNT